MNDLFDKIRGGTILTVDEWRRIMLDKVAFKTASALLGVAWGRGIEKIRLRDAKAKSALQKNRR